MKDNRGQDQTDVCTRRREDHIYLLLVGTSQAWEAGV